MKKSILKDKTREEKRNLFVLQDGNKKKIVNQNSGLLVRVFDDLHPCGLLEGLFGGLLEGPSIVGYDIEQSAKFVFWKKKRFFYE